MAPANENTIFRPTDEYGKATTPCERCKATGLDCVIGSSNRGGRRVRKRTVDQAGLDEKAPPSHPPFEERRQTSSAIDEGENDHIQFQDESLTPSVHNPRPSWTSEYGAAQPNGNILQEINQTPGIMLDPALQAADSNARYVGIVLVALGCRAACSLRW